jgi:hypothetical protein
VPTVFFSSCSAKAEHPRVFSSVEKKRVDGRAKPDHDEKEAAERNEE